MEVLALLVFVLTFLVVYLIMRVWASSYVVTRTLYRGLLNAPYYTEDVTGYVYAFIDPEEPNLVKWGRAKNWQQRMKQHQTPHPRRLKVLCIVGVRDDREAEKEVHKLFEAQAVDDNGGQEWFYRTAEMDSFIIAVRDNVNLEEW